MKNCLFGIRSNILNNLPLISLLVIACAFRLYGALKVPYVFDELIKDRIVADISFNLSNLRMPIGNQEIARPLLNAYLMRLGYDVFGRGVFGGRILVMMLATSGLYFIYALARLGLDREKALCALFLSVFCQFHIGWSRLNEEDGLLLFFAPVILYTFYTAIAKNRKNLLFLTGVLLGMGSLAKPTVVLIIPGLFLFCLIDREQRKFIRDIKSYIAIVGIPLIILAPYICWNFMNNMCDFRDYAGELHGIGLGLMPAALFLGEAIVHSASWLSDDSIAYLTSPEYPFMHWPLGVLCIIGALYACRHRNAVFIRFLLVIFFVAAGILSLINSHGYIHLDEFWWASILFTPAVIFAANLLIDLKNKYRIFKAIAAAFLFYSFVHALYFVNFPENYFVPRKNMVAQHLCERAGVYISEGKQDKAAMLYEMIIKMKPDERIVRQAQSGLSGLAVQ